MKRGKSRLDTLLRVRRIEEELQRGRLAAAAASERGAKRGLDQAQQEYEGSAPVAGVADAAADAVLDEIADARVIGPGSGVAQTVRPQPRAQSQSQAQSRVGSLSLAAFARQRRHRDALAGAVRAAGTAAEAAAQAKAMARQSWSEAAMRMTALERLDERARESARLERLAADQRTSEESSAGRAGRGTAKGRGRRA